jgi:hypothetical protein
VLWLRTVIPAMREVEIRRTEVQCELRQRVIKTPSQQARHGGVPVIPAM